MTKWIVSTPLKGTNLMKNFVCFTEAELWKLLEQYPGASVEMKDSHLEDHAPLPLTDDQWRRTMKTKKDRITNFWDNVFWYAEAHECLNDLKSLLNGRYYSIKNKRNGNISLTTLFAIADALDVDEAGIFFEEVDNVS